MPEPDTKLLDRPEETHPDRGEDQPKRGETENDHGREKGEHKESGEKPKRSLRRRVVAFPREHPLGFLILLIVLAAAAVAAVLLWRYFSSYESTDDAQVTAHLNPVTPRINGTVIGVYTENNRSVVQNQTLADLDPRDYQVAVEQARANLTQALGQLAAENPNVPITQTTNLTTVATAEAGLTSAQASLAAAQHDYDSAVADLRQAEANSQVAQADEARYRQLVGKDEVSREQYDQRLAAARASAAQVDARRSAMNSAERVIAERQAAVAQATSQLNQTRQNNPRNLAVRQADIKTRQGAVDLARAQVANALLQLSYCKILAPAAGVVGNKHLEVGQRVQAGDQLMVITQVEDQWVDADFKETQIARMRPGQHVTIHVDAFDQDFSGWVQNLPGATGAQYSLLPPENATGNYVKVVQRLPVRIRLNRGQAGMERLRPGMSVEPKVWLE